MGFHLYARVTLPFEDAAHLVLPIVSTSARQPPPAPPPRPNPRSLARVRHPKERKERARQIKMRLLQVRRPQGAARTDRGGRRWLGLVSRCMLPWRLSVRRRISELPGLTLRHPHPSPPGPPQKQQMSQMLKRQQRIVEMQAKATKAGAKMVPEQPRTANKTRPSATPAPGWRYR